MNELQEAGRLPFPCRANPVLAKIARRGYDTVCAERKEGTDDEEGCRKIND